VREAVVRRPSSINDRSDRRICWRDRYFIVDSRAACSPCPKPLQCVTNIIKSADSHGGGFETRAIKDTHGENARDPGNRLLEKLGVIPMTKVKNSLHIGLTDKGANS
jgi:hypothetical protein